MDTHTLENMDRMVGCFPEFRVTLDPIGDSGKRGKKKHKNINKNIKILSEPPSMLFQLAQASNIHRREFYKTGPKKCSHAWMQMKINSTLQMLGVAGSQEVIEAFDLMGFVK